jgi:hypothetical protein
LSFDYRVVTAIEIKKGLFTGTFEVLTPATQNAQKSYWAVGNNSAARSDNVVTFQRKGFEVFQRAAEIGRELMTKSHNHNTNNNYLQELEKLSDLKEKGIITDEEFTKKKKQILGA